MRRQLICFVTTALLIGLFGVDISAGKRSRGSRRSERAHAKRESRGKASRGHSARSRRDERRPSRRERRNLARSGGTVRERVIVRGRHGRRLVRYRYVRRSEPDVTASAPRPAAPRQSGGGIPAERVTEIQNALIKAGYMEGPASGQYDDNTIQAMKQFQESNRLSQTGMPSASTLKKLGVAKRSNDGYAMPVNSVSENDKKRPSP
ncbi:MAG TPA: peptidoglycan-binding domain-containing protein [Blastocatellia bacterium]|nr:peptidoglycan-binding domain-containing protein [Blastocatellia bacterium]